MVRHLKGLEDVISITVVHPTWRKTKPDDKDDHHNGWVFGAPQDSDETFANTAGDGGPFTAALEGCDPNPLFESFSIRDVYEKARDTDGKHAVPILWDHLPSTKLLATSRLAKSNVQHLGFIKLSI